VPDEGGRCWSAGGTPLSPHVPLEACSVDGCVNTLGRRFCGISPRRHWTKPSTTPSPSLAEGVFTVTHPFHPLYGQQFEILSCRHNWGEYRVTFYETADHVRGLPAAWTSIVPPDSDVILAVGRGAFRVGALLLLCPIIQRDVVRTV